MKRDPLPSIAPVSAGVPPAWRLPLAALALTVAWILFGFFDTARGIVEIWERSETFAHGFVVAPISLWLIWRLRARLATLTPRPNLLVLIPLAASGLAWLVGEVAAVNVLMQFALVAMLVLCVPALLGIAVTRVILFPLAFLFFAVPFGEFLMPTLMSHTADFTVLALRASGIPVYREGLQFVIPTGRWSVVEACSGIRYLIASVVVGTLFAYLNYSSLRKRLAFVAVSIAVPIVANWLRAYMIVMLGHLSGNRLATGVDHLVYGWVFFGIVMLVMFAIGSRFREVAAADAHHTSTPPEPFMLAPAAGNTRIVGAALAVAALTAVWPVLDRQFSKADSEAVLALAPVSGWTSVPETQPSFTPHFLNASATYQRHFEDADGRVGLYVAYYRGQKHDRKMISSDNVLVRSDDPTWNAISTATRSVSLGSATAQIASARLLARSNVALTAWQWFWIDGTVTSSSAIAKAKGAWQALTGRGDDAAVIVVYTMGDVASERSHDQRLARFVKDAWPMLSHALEDAKHPAQ